MDEYHGEGLRRAHLVGDLTAVAAGVLGGHRLKVKQLVPDCHPPREGTTHAAPLEGERGRPVSQALQLQRLPGLHRSVLRDRGGVRRAWGKGTQRGRGGRAEVRMGQEASQRTKETEW